MRKRHPYSTLAAHAADLAEQALEDGERIMLVGEHSRIPAVVEADEAQKPCVVSMSHGWESLPGDEQDYLAVGANTSLLVSDDSLAVEQINAMARMTAVPVRLERA